LAEASSLSLEELRMWVEDVFDSIDSDGSQEIEYTEWLAAAMGESTARSEAAMLAAFRVFDTNNDGKIDGEDFAKVMTHTPSEVGTMMRPMALLRHVTFALFCHPRST
jgi:Ca2+-binding EF-hand superfamily protein